ncbi:MAG: hypothetical protein FJ254_09115 [Phycisphaerae bacterium]|nr:hypothetical protein [Phycisphaerae bacterium]
MTRPARKDGGAQKPAAKTAKAAAKPTIKAAAKASDQTTAQSSAQAAPKRPRKAAAVSPTVKSLTRVTRQTPEPIDTPQPVVEHAEPEVEVESTEVASTSHAVEPSTDAPSVRPEHGFQPRRAEHPRRVHHGIRLRRKAGMEGFPWWAQAWFKGMESGFADAVRIEGLQYAQSGQVVTMEIVPGTARMKVQGRATRPYECSMTFHPWTSEQWTAVVAAMSQEAIHAARLLTGELPQGAERLVSGLGLRLFPMGLKSADPIVECACKEPHPCKHVHAAACVLAERIEVDPLVLFTLRGLAGERLLERIQEHRALTNRGVQSAHNPPPVAQHPPELRPITELVHDFWRPGRALSELDDAAAVQHIPHALLRRLGPSSLGGRFRLVGLLASAYDTIRLRALTPRLDAPPPCE